MTRTTDETAVTIVSLWYDQLHREIAARTARGSVPAWAQGVLDSIGAGRLPVRAVRHPLGFLCLPVERAPGYGVCLHLWSERFARAGTTTSAVHCHSWELLSFVLYGRLENVAAVITDAGRDATHQVFEVTGRGDTDEIRATGRTVRFRPGPAESYRTGDVYALPAGVFHSSRVGGGQDTATVALGRDVGGADLSLGALDTPTHHVRRGSCDAAETARAAQLAAARLAAAHTG